MPARHHEAEEGRLQLGMGQVVGGDVPADVVDGHEGLSRREGEPLGVVDPHEQRADEPRRGGHRDGVDPLERDARLVERALHHRHDVLAVAAGGDLRHHAAVDAVLRHLRVDDRRKDPAPVLHHGGGRLVAGAFDR